MRHARHVELSRARNTLLQEGLGDLTDPGDPCVLEQLMRKHPGRKRQIRELSHYLAEGETGLAVPHDLLKTIRELTTGIARPGLLMGSVVSELLT